MEKGAKKVLIIEDDEALLDVLAGHLVESNYEVLKATDGEEGVRKVVDKKPDLILLDLLLPKLDGFKVLERVRNYPDKAISETKVVVLSNLWSDKDILRAQALKIDEYYVKTNTNMDDVFKKVDQLLG